MNIHILGICGTFMGGIALLARELGHEVSGSDANVYPPMSVQLQEAGIHLHEGYSADPLRDGQPDRVIVGNALSRGNPAVEYMLNNKLNYCSGPEWLRDTVLADRQVFAVSGTHGKTTTTAMLCWVLEQAGRNPGFLIGGVAENFGLSARLGEQYFVVEADEYDTAFFDKRSKFIHYRPDTLVINNIEFDHGDIFGSLDDIVREFRRLIRTVPSNGRIIVKQDDVNIRTVLDGGCWTPVTGFGAEGAVWQLGAGNADMSAFEVMYEGQIACKVNWDLIGRHNAENALAVIAAVSGAGIDPRKAAEALAGFRSVKRRLQRLAVVGGISVYDDFAHHPTAMRVTLDALRGRTGRNQRIIAVFELRSNTMKLGTHKDLLAGSVQEADQVVILRPASLGWDLHTAMAPLRERLHIFDTNAQIIDFLSAQLRAGDHALIMSNGSFGGLHAELITQLRYQHANG